MVGPVNLMSEVRCRALCACVVGRLVLAGRPTVSQTQSTLTEASCSAVWAVCVLCMTQSPSNPRRVLCALWRSVVLSRELRHEVF